MEPELLNELLSPWWRLPLSITVTVFAVVVGAIGVKLAIKFDINVWLQDRRSAKAFKARKKHADRCRHMWTLYHASPFSLCNLCLAYIATSTLLLYFDSPEVIIVGENWGYLLKPAAGSVVAMHPVGIGR